MELIALVRKTGMGREQRQAQTFADARAVLDEWEQHPLSDTAAKKGGEVMPKKRSVKPKH